MISITWGLRETHVWQEELPLWEYTSSQVIERDQITPNMKLIDTRSCAIELFIPTGPRAHYGGLSAIFVPENSRQLKIQVPVSPDDGPILKTSLANTFDTVHIGLPAEYIEGVFDGAMNDTTTQLLGSGTLRFHGATHGEIGSSRWFFRILSQLVVKLISLETSILTEELIIRLIQEVMLQNKQSH